MAASKPLSEAWSVSTTAIIFQSSATGAVSDSSVTALGGLVGENAGEIYQSFASVLPAVAAISIPPSAVWSAPMTVFR
jgi:hypothetical protein